MATTENVFSKEELHKFMNGLTENVMDKIGSLYGRWMDEKEYEDWNDYVDMMKKMFTSPETKFVKATKRPFGVVSTAGGWEAHMFVRGNRLTWKASQQK